jgi:low affinity Fe/Cu permease
LAFSVDRLICRATTLASSNVALAVSFSGMLYWVCAAPDWLGRVDGLLSGGATMFAQMIYREAAPRDDALHKKLDAIIHGTDADDELAGIEKSTTGAGG